MIDLQAKLFARNAGRELKIGRMTMLFKMTAGDTQGAYSVIEALVPPESGSNLHRHWSYDESAFVLDGKFDCYVDGKQKTFGAGESIFWPRGAVHRFKGVGPGDGRMLFICSPGKIFEDFAEQIANPAVETGTATSGPAPDFRAIAARHGIEAID